MNSIVMNNNFLEFEFKIETENLLLSFQEKILRMLDEVNESMNSADIQKCKKFGFSEKKIIKVVKK